MQKQQCYCRSCELYANQDEKTMNVGESSVKQTRQFQKAHQVSPKIIEQLQQSSELYLPYKINKISIDQILLNPLWFYKEYLAKNIPVVIMNTLDGDQITERWADQKYMEQALQGQKLSLSLTPDGFADSIKGKYFVEPQQVKTGIKGFFDTEEMYPNSIAYLQHQNNNLSQELAGLQAEIPQQTLLMLSQSLFDSKMPDAQNLWLGRRQSVSALHKDPYQNFYTTIVGEKHFTLIPPIGILRMEQFQYLNSKWSYNNDHNFSIKPQPHSSKTKWIACNPDLAGDTNKFPSLKQMRKYHVVLEAGQMLYLPSLWYHQVSQQHPKDKYALAINYWFDMSFSQNHSLYQLCRTIKGL